MCDHCSRDEFLSYLSWKVRDQAVAMDVSYGYGSGVWFEAEQYLTLEERVQIATSLLTAVRGLENVAVWLQKRSLGDTQHRAWHTERIAAAVRKALCEVIGHDEEGDGED